MLRPGDHRSDSRPRRSRSSGACFVDAPDRRGRVLSIWHGAKRCFWVSRLCNVEFNSKLTFSKLTKELLSTKTVDPQRLTCEDRILHDTEVWIPTSPPFPASPLRNASSRDAQCLTVPGPHASCARLSSNGILRRRFTYGGCSFEEGCPASLAPTSGLELSYYAPRTIWRALREVLIRESLLTYASQQLEREKLGVEGNAATRSDRARGGVER